MDTKLEKKMLFKKWKAIRKRFVLPLFLKKHWPSILSVAALAIIPIFYLTREEKTIYYCIDRYKTYLEAKQKFGDDLNALQNFYVEEVTKYEANGELNKGYIREPIWYIKNEEWHRDFSMSSYSIGGKDITKQIDYTNKPCIIKEKEKSITCEIGYYHNTTFGYYSAKLLFYEVYTYLEGGFQKMVLLAHPNNPSARNDVDVCFIKGKSPFDEFAINK